VNASGNGPAQDERLRALVEGGPDSLLIIDADGTIAFVNASAERMFDYAREELVGRPHGVLLAGSFDERFEEAEATADADQVRQIGADLDVHGRRKDGSEFPIEINYRRMRSDGGATQVAASVRDVSRRREAETDLRAAMSLLSATLESTADGILVVSAEGRVAGANERFAQMWGIPADLLASNDDDRVMGFVLDQLADAPAFVAKVHELYEHPGAESNDVLHFRDGRVFERYSRPQRVGDDIVGRVWSFRDVTELRAQQRELVAAQAAALEASRTKSEFLATMSHEIRTPMNGVIGLTGLLLATELDEVQARYATGIRGAGEALLSIVDDILDFSRLEAGRIDLEEVEFSPRQLVEEVGVLLAEVARSQGLELIVHCEASVPAVVVGDPGRLRQALINLAGNAVKFTPAGEVAVSVTTEPLPHGRTASPDLLRFAVRDTGIGIDAATLSRLFEPFSQADASTTRRFGGTGLGLAISRRLVTAMGGELTVSSEPGIGSLFAFTLQLPVAQDAALAPTAAGLAGLRALVVDDNETNRTTLTALLAAWGVDTTTAADAGHALGALRRAAAADTPYDVALLDLRMPDIDGLDLAAAITHDPTLATTRCMILSSGGQPDHARAASAGIQEWINKPVRLADLRDALVRMGDLRCDDERDQPAADPVPEAEPADRAVDRGGRVLVAEDNTVNQLVARGVLENLGYTVEVVDNGREALDALRSTRFDVVLMDCHMPELDGFEATRALRVREGDGHRTPVIAMTAGVLDSDRERCFAAGMDDFIAKPIDVGTLTATLDRWIPREREAPSLDIDRLDALRAVGPADGWGLLPTVVRAFLAAAAGHLEKLRAAASADDADAIRREAHTLRGAAANLGVDGVVEACRDIEAAASTGDQDALLGVLEGRLADACGALDELLASRDGPSS
jgi:PAS domain S-box-containing protein